jgi:general secretion pathway protein L
VDGDTPPPASGPFVALVPGAEAPLIALQLPATLAGSARENVARRQVLDRLGQPATQLEIRAFAGRGGAWSRVAVADKTRLRDWRTALGAAAARCKGVVPDYLALPTAPGLWTLGVTPEGIEARLGPEDGFTAEPVLAQAMLAQALATARAAGGLPRAALLLGDVGAGVEALFEGVPLCRALTDLPEGIVPQVFGHGEGAVDFARDPGADAAAIERVLRHLVWPVALLLVGALGWAGAAWLSTRHDLAAARAIDAATLEAAQRDILPPGPVLDLRVQVAREIERRRAQSAPQDNGTDPLSLLRRAAQALTEAGVEVETLALGPGIDGVSVGLRVGDFRALDGVMTALAGAGIQARVQRSGTDPEGGVSAEVLVVAGGQP